MLNRKSFGFDWGQFITGILFLIAAFVVMRYPLATLKTVTFIFAVVAIIRGIAILAGYSTLRQLTGKLAWVSLLMGIFDLVIGVIFLVNSNFGVATITMMFAIWFLVDSVGSLFNLAGLSFTSFWIFWQWLCLWCCSCSQWLRPSRWSHYCRCFSSYSASNVLSLPLHDAIFNEHRFYLTWCSWFIALHQVF